jgi:hypothetical protein
LIRSKCFLPINHLTPPKDNGISYQQKTTY